MPNLVKSSQDTTLTEVEAVNKELKAATSIQKKRKICIEHFIMHKS